jgi:predicted O-methyltransferase YrrM
MKQILKRQTQYPGAPQTGYLRALIDQDRRPGWPYVTPDEGDLLHWLAAHTPNGRALQIGCATGSTAIYMLAGMPEGSLVSIDFDHGNHDRAGEALIARAGFAPRHRLIEENSIEVLPRLHAAGERFDLIFLDGWKTFDHVWVDTFYCARMLAPGGFIMFDDARMPAVRKCVRLLRAYYLFELLDHYRIIGGARLRLWHMMTTRDLLHPPYLALRKPSEIADTPAGRQFDFWAPF